MSSSSQFDQATLPMPTPITVAGSGPTQASAIHLHKGQTFGVYRIEEKLGEGGMGVVFRAVQSPMERSVALKLMRPELVSAAGYAERFVREARTAAAVCHQNAVVLFDAGDVNGCLYMAFQYVPGGDLNELVEREGALPALRALEIVMACCDGLEAIHEAGLLHRDIKPHNIFMDAKGRPKLGDFGLARCAQGTDRVTMTGMGMGTPAYMAPEQAHGSETLDGRADIHALGGTLYHLITGQAPFLGATPWMVVNAVCNSPPPDPRLLCGYLPIEMTELLAKAMAKSPDDRFASPAEFKAAIMRVHRLLQGLPEAPVLPTISDDHALLGPFVRWRWVWWVATMVAAISAPVALNPVLTLNPDYQPLSYMDPVMWALWLGMGVLSVGLLWVPLRVSQGREVKRARLVMPVVAGSIVAGTMTGFATQAFMAMNHEHTWSRWAMLAGVAMSVYVVLSSLKLWKQRQVTAVLWRVLIQPLWVSIIGVLALLISHYDISQNPDIKKVEVAIEPSVYGKRLNEPDKRTVIEKHWNTQIAWLLSVAVPLSFTLIAPALLVVRRQRIPLVVETKK